MNKPVNNTVYRSEGRKYIANVTIPHWVGVFMAGVALTLADCIDSGLSKEDANRLFKEIAEIIAPMMCKVTYEEKEQEANSSGEGQK